MAGINGIIVHHTLKMCALALLAFYCLKLGLVLIAFSIVNCPGRVRDLGWIPVPLKC